MTEYRKLDPGTPDRRLRGDDGVSQALRFTFFLALGFAFPTVAAYSSS
jgi:hypothetical protein